MLRLLRLSSSNGGLEPSPPNADSNPRNGSPFGGSILMTSAPQSPSTADADGPATHIPTSTTRMPSIGPGMGGAYAAAPRRDPLSAQRFEGVGRGDRVRLRQVRLEPERHSITGPQQRVGREADAVGPDAPVGGDIEQLVRSAGDPVRRRATDRDRL